MQTALLSLQSPLLKSQQPTISHLKHDIQLAFEQQNYVQASSDLHKLLKILPHDSDTLLNFAYAELKQLHHKVAYQYYLLALQHQPKHLAEIYDGLAETCYYLKKNEEQIHYARCALNTKKSHGCTRTLLFSTHPTCTTV